MTLSSYRYEESMSYLGPWIEWGSSPSHRRISILFNEQAFLHLKDRCNVYKKVFYNDWAIKNDTADAINEHHESSTIFKFILPKEVNS